MEPLFDAIFPTAPELSSTLNYVPYVEACRFVDPPLASISFSTM